MGLLSFIFKGSIVDKAPYIKRITKLFRDYETEFYPQKIHMDKIIKCCTNVPLQKRSRR